MGEGSRLEIRIKFFNEDFKNFIFGGVGSPLPVLQVCRNVFLALFDLNQCSDHLEIGKLAP